jgi:SAM-dependent methyltransferase
MAVLAIIVEKMSFKKLLPWYLRMTAKIVLARFPLGYRLWKRMGIFAHGDMNLPSRALDIFLEHAKTAGLIPFPKMRDWTVLELGPGDSVFTSLIAYAVGASRSYLVDAGHFATQLPSAYADMTSCLYANGLKFPSQVNENFDKLLKDCNSVYLTNGVASMSLIPDCSIDYCFSNAVLEHIPYAEFRIMATELLRVLKPCGVCVHRVDLKDHLGGGLNNLRFSMTVWEGKLFSRSGFYTNRIRYSEMLSIFNQVGFDCEVTRKVVWEKLPISRKSLASAFQELSDEELCVSGFDLLLRPKIRPNV